MSIDKRGFDFLSKNVFMVKLNISLSNIVTMTKGKFVLMKNCPPPFGASKDMHPMIHTSWVLPVCIGSVQFLQSAAKEQKNGLQNVVNGDKAANSYLPNTRSSNQATPTISVWRQRQKSSFYTSPAKTPCSTSRNNTSDLETLPFS
jgi:hypothetical protein